MGKTTVTDIMKLKGIRPITSLTAYDYFTASFIDQAGVDLILVGDSVAMVLYGYQNTLKADIPMMLRHTEAVASATKNALVVADMPFLSYQTSIGDAIKNAGELLRAGAQAVKIEGGWKYSATIKALVETGIPVLGHIGMLPQSVNRLGGYKLRGTEPDEEAELLEDARSIEEAGAFAVVIEKVEKNVSRKITETLKIPTIGIGSGSHCDGQILVINDILGLFDRFTPPYVKQYANLKEIIIDAVKRYIDDVKNKKYPAQRVEIL